MRLIDADANIETMKKCAENPENEQALLCYRYAQRILEEAPTVPTASQWHRVVFTYEGMAQHVAEKLGEGWKVIDISQEACRKAERLMAAIFDHIDEPPKEDA